MDWDNRSLAVLYSKDDVHLAAVTAVVPNLSAASGSAGQGDFHFGVLKVWLELKGRSDELMIDG